MTVRRAIVKTIQYPLASICIVAFPLMLLIGAFMEPDRKFREVLVEVWNDYTDLWRWLK